MRPDICGQYAHKNSMAIQAVDGPRILVAFDINQEAVRLGDDIILTKDRTQSKIGGLISLH